MSNSQEGRKPDSERKTIRRTAEFKSRLSEASYLLALKMAERRKEWDTK